MTPPVLDADQAEVFAIKVASDLVARLRTRWQDLFGASVVVSDSSRWSTTPLMEIDPDMVERVVTGSDGFGARLIAKPMGVDFFEALFDDLLRALSRHVFAERAVGAPANQALVVAALKRWETYLLPPGLDNVGALLCEHERLARLWSSSGSGSIEEGRCETAILACREKIAALSDNGTNLVIPSIAAAARSVADALDFYLVRLDASSRAMAEGRHTAAHRSTSGAHSDALIAAAPTGRVERSPSDDESGAVAPERPMGRSRLGP